jgi:hypothetical protein
MVWTPQDLPLPQHVCTYELVGTRGVTRRRVSTRAHRAAISCQGSAGAAPRGGSDSYVGSGRWHGNPALQGCVGVRLLLRVLCVRAKPGAREPNAGGRNRRAACKAGGRRILAATRGRVRSAAARLCGSFPKRSPLPWIDRGPAGRMCRGRRSAWNRRSLGSPRPRKPSMARGRAD